MELLAVEPHPFPARQKVQTPVAEAPPLAGKLAKPLSKSPRRLPALPDNDRSSAQAR